MQEEYNFYDNKTLLFLSLPTGTTEQLIIENLHEFTTKIKTIKVEGPLAHIECDSHQTALEIHQKRSNYLIKEKKITICWNLPKELKESTKHNFDLFNLKDEITDESLQLYFNNKITIISLLFHQNN